MPLSVDECLAHWIAHGLGLGLGLCRDDVHAIVWAHHRDPMPTPCHPMSLQETEEALEELRAKLRDTKTRMDSEVDTLNSQVSGMLARGAALPCPE